MHTNETGRNRSIETESDEGRRGQSMAKVKEGGAQFGRDGEGILCK